MTGSACCSARPTATLRGSTTRIASLSRRGESTHIGFGGGVHFCIGAPLARLELAVSLSQLRAAAPGLRLAAEPEYQPYFVIRGLRALVVTTG